MEQLLEWFNIFYLISIKLGLFILAIYILRQWKGRDGFWDKEDAAQLVFLIVFIFVIWMDANRPDKSNPKFSEWFYLMLFTVVLSIAKLESVIQLFATLVDKIKNLKNKSENK